ncbi:MAG: dihydropteroate synthase [Bacteroidia bacterium]|nr:dihydropteroate synthase [Bacteroidia bacterium]
MQALFSKNYINCGGNLISLDTPKVMGILNITPDSFFEGSRVGSNQGLLVQTEYMLKHGATFIDIGGQSTRPGAELIGEEEELSRVIPAIEQIIRHFPEAVISIDTFSAKVARVAINAGACLINDISAGDDDAGMFPLLSELRVPYIMMHKKGTPQDMQNDPRYENIVLEIIDYFAAKLELLKSLGVADVVLDPGFGFGKTLEHNYELLAKLDRLKLFELPVLVGVSRKSMIQKVLQISANEALNGTSALHMIALERGAKILRVHDVKEAMECVKLHSQLGND